MNNLGSLFKYEIKKVFDKKSVLITFLIGLVFLILMNCGMYFINKYECPDGTMIRGAERFEKEKESEAKYSGRIINDELLNEGRNEVIDFAIEKGYVTKQDVEDLKNGKKTKGYIMPIGNQVGSVGEALKAAARQKGLNNFWDFLNNVMKNDQATLTCSGTEFNEAIKEGVNLGDDNTQYWEEESKKIQTPVTYEYTQGYSNFLDCAFALGWFLFLFIVISLAGIYADERTLGTDALVISSRNGRNPTAIAKLLAGLTIGILSGAVLFILLLLLNMVTFGASGWDAIIQLYRPECPWNATFGDIIVKEFIMMIVIAVLFSTVTMLLSRIASAVQTMAIQVAIFILFLFNMPLEGKLNDLWGLRPTGIFGIEHFCNPSLFEIGSINLSFNQMASGIYIAVAVIAMVITIVLHNKSQVKSR